MERKIKSAENRKCVREMQANSDREVECVKETEDGKQIAAGKWEGNV